MIENTKLLTSFFLENRKRVLFQFLLDFFSNLFHLILPLLIAQSYAILFGFQSVKNRLLANLGIIIPDSFLALMLIILFVFLIAVVFDFYRIRNRGKLVEKWVFNIRQQLFKHHLQTDIRVYEEKGIGRFLLRFSGDLSSVQHFISKGILQFFADVLFIFMGLIAMSFMDFLLAGFIGVSIVVLQIAVFFIIRNIGIVEALRRDAKSALLSFINGSLLNMGSIKAFNKEGPLEKRFKKRADKIEQLGIQYHQWVSNLDVLMNCFFYLVTCSLLVLIYSGLGKGWLEASPALLGIVIIFLSWKPVLSRTIKVGLIWKKGRISLRKIDQILNLPMESGIHLEDQQKLIPSGISLKQVSLSFKERNVFEHLSFSLQPGQTGIIIGQTNGGKTVVTKLLAGLYPAQKGQVFIGENQLTALHPKAARRVMTFVSEAFPIFGRTILEAVTYSQQKEAKTRQQFQDWQLIFPQLQDLDLDAPFADGAKLSKSQLQLLSWFRACLTRKAFFIIDDGFLYLPPDTIKKLMQLIPKNSGKLFLLSPDEYRKIEDWQADWVLDIKEFEKNKVLLGNN